MKKKTVRVDDLEIDSLDCFAKDPHLSFGRAKKKTRLCPCCGNGTSVDECVMYGIEVLGDGEDERFKKEITDYADEIRKEQQSRQFKYKGA